MDDHPGQTASIYDIPQICLHVRDRAAIPTNIKSGFRFTSIRPFDKIIFTAEDYLSFYVTDRPGTAQSNSPVTSHNSVDQCASFLLIGQLLAIAPSADEHNVELIRVTTTADSTLIMLVIT